MQTNNWPTHLLRCSKKLHGIEITCTAFEQVTRQIPDGAFLFVDPPYFNADQDKFYTCSFSKEDHYRLCELLFKHKDRIKYLITYDNTLEIRELYEWVTEMHDKEWNYTINRTDDQRNGKKLEHNYK